MDDRMRKEVEEEKKDWNKIASYIKKHYSL